jgi:VWFA-related protein
MMKLACVLTALLLGAGIQDPPQFKSGVEMITLDVQVVGADGEPVLGLRASDFQVTIDGRRRAVASVQFLEQASRTRFVESRRQPGDPDAAGAATVSRAEDGRIFMLAVDENSLWTAYARAANEAARLFIDRLAPRDYVGLATFPTSSLLISPTQDHHEVRDALDRIVGMRSAPPAGLTRLSPSEIFDITAGDADVLARVVSRACHPTDRQCPRQVQADAASLAQDMAASVHQSLAGLRDLIAALKTVEGRKTLVLLSGGMPMSDRIGGGFDVRSQMTLVGRLAAEANLTLYVLHLDTSFAAAFAGRGGPPPETLMRDSTAYHMGLGMVAGAAGGRLFQVTTEADAAFDRVLRETSGYYLLAIAPLESERDGKPRRVTVDVTRRGAEVRARNTVTVPEGTARTP